MKAGPKLSVVICYRNWGGERLRLAVESHLRSSLADEIEVIVSDFGSDASRKAENYVRDERVRCVYTDTDEPWSRGRALNAGVAASKGEFILAWDADIICGPEMHASLLGGFAMQPNAACVFQCRDLSEQFDESKITSIFTEQKTVPLDVLQKNSVWRPRWGLGIAAYSRKVFDLIRGYDERFVVWGAEDRDLMQRFSRMGIAVRWVEDEAAQIFHIYHESTQESVLATMEGQATVYRNKDYANRDRTLIRNLVAPAYFKPLNPLVSVVVATYNRAKYIESTIASILTQTFTDFELIVVDDGSTDGTAELLRQIDDPRVVVVSQLNQGVAAARNTGIRRARGHYIVVHDDDDIMLQDRLVSHLKAITGNYGGSYGGWVDFDQDSGQFVSVNPGKTFSDATIAYAGKVLLHPTVMVTRHIAESIPYDERYKGGSDFNWMMTIAASGAQLVHTGNIHILRRLHGESLTSAGSGQKHASRYSARSMNASLNSAAVEALRTEGRAGETIECQQQGNLEELYEYLPAELRRSVHWFSAVLDKPTFQKLVRHLKQTGPAVSLTSVEPVAQGAVRIRGLYEVRGMAENPVHIEACCKAVGHAYKSRPGYAPRGIKELQLKTLERIAPEECQFDINARVGSFGGASECRLLAVLADYFDVPDSEILIAVVKKHEGSTKVYKADRALKQVLKGKVRQLACLQTEDGAVPVYGISGSENHAEWIGKISTLWSMRNTSLVVYQKSDHPLS